MKKSPPSNHSTSSEVVMLEIDDIAIANPRARNERAHKAIVRSIEQVGLKRPITVRQTPGGATGHPFALVCGQGRMEACRLLGHRQIAAFVIEVDESTAHIMSIVENVARRTPRAAETLEHVRVLRERGYSDSQVAEKLGCSPSWVNNVTTLLQKGEKRLLAAAEAGHIPLHLAVGIARASDAETQQLLQDAYENGDLRGKQVFRIRQILEYRSRSGKQSKSGFVKSGPRKSMTREELAKLYKRDVAAHQRIQMKSEYVQQSLLVARQVFKELYADEEFVALLQAQKLTTVPRPLADLVPAMGGRR